MSRFEAFLIAGICWLAACLGAARFAMTRTARWLILAFVALGALLVLGGLWWRDSTERVERTSRPLWIVSRDCSLKTGNGQAWPERLKFRLPRGVEVRELNRRGGWIQIELAGGAAGWLPESCLSPVS